MKKIKSLLLLFSFHFIVSLIATSCCKDCFKITGNGNTYILSSHSESLDTIQGSFIIRWILDGQSPDQCFRMNLIPVVNATSCEEIFINMIVRESIELLCNRTIYFKQDSIPAGTNLLEIGGLKLDLDLHYGILEFHFDEELISSLRFSRDFHEFSMKLETNDGKLFTNRKSAFIQL